MVENNVSLISFVEEFEISKEFKENPLKIYSISSVISDYSEKYSSFKKSLKKILDKKDKREISSIANHLEKAVEKEYKKGEKTGSLNEKFVTLLEATNFVIIEDVLYEPKIDKVYRGINKLKNLDEMYDLFEVRDKRFIKKLIKEYKDIFFNKFEMYANSTGKILGKFNKESKKLKSSSTELKYLMEKYK